MRELRELLGQLNDAASALAVKVERAVVLGLRGLSFADRGACDGGGRAGSTEGGGRGQGVCRR